jgi:hypothetical protein
MTHYERIYFVQPIAIPWKELSQREQFFHEAYWTIERMDATTMRLTEKHTGNVLEVTGVGFSVWAKAVPKAADKPKGKPGAVA